MNLKLSQLSFSSTINHKRNDVEIQYSNFLFILKTSTFLFQDEFCQLLNIECPTEEQHEAMDLNDDGNLTWAEYLEATFGMLDEERTLAEEFEN